jgi:hypothetical protein
VCIDHLQETRWPTAMLDVRLALRTGGGGGEKNTCLPFDKFGKFVSNLRCPAALAFHPGIGSTRTLTRLDSLDAGGEGDIAGVMVGFVHGCSSLKIKVSVGPQR